MIKRKEQILGKESALFIKYLCEIVKVFNQTGMQLMNSSRFIDSQQIFKSLIAFMSALEIKYNSASISAGNGGVENSPEKADERKVP